MIEYIVNKVAIPDIPIYGADMIKDKETFFEHALEYKYDFEYEGDLLKTQVSAQVTNNIFKIKKMMYDDVKQTRYTFTMNQFIQFYHFCNNIFKGNGSWQKNESKKLYSTGLQCSCNYSSKRALEKLSKQKKSGYNDDDDDNNKNETYNGNGNGNGNGKHYSEKNQEGNFENGIEHAHMDDDQSLFSDTFEIHSKDSFNVYHGVRLNPLEITVKRRNKRTTFFKCPVRYTLTFNFEIPGSPIVTIVNRSGPHTHPITDFEKKSTSMFHDSLAKEVMIKERETSISSICNKMNNKLVNLSKKYDIKIHENVIIHSARVRNLMKKLEFGETMNLNNDYQNSKIRMPSRGEFESIAVWKINDNNNNNNNNNDDDDESLVDRYHYLGGQQDEYDDLHIKRQKIEGHDNGDDYEQYTNLCIGEMEELFYKYQSLINSIAKDENYKENCKKLVTQLDSFVNNAYSSSTNGNL